MATDHVGAMNLAVTAATDIIASDMDESVVQNDARVTFTNHTGFVLLSAFCSLSTPFGASQYFSTLQHCINQQLSK